MKRTRLLRRGALVALIAAALLAVAPRAGALDFESKEVTGSGTYTGTQDGNPVTGDIDVKLTCLLDIVCFGGVKVNGVGGLTIGLVHSPDEGYEFALSGIQIVVGGPKYVEISAVSIQLATGGSFVWGSDPGAIVGQLDAGGFAIG